MLRRDTTRQGNYWGEPSRDAFCVRIGRHGSCFSTDLQAPEDHPFDDMHCQREGERRQEQYTEDCRRQTGHQNPANGKQRHNRHVYGDREQHHRRGTRAPQKTALAQYTGRQTPAS
jgi:hypothetical protein